MCCLSKSLDMSLNNPCEGMCRHLFSVSQVSGEYSACFYSKYTLRVKTDTNNFKVLRTMRSFEGLRTCGLRAVLGENHADVWACASFQKQMWNVPKKKLRAGDEETWLQHINCVRRTLKEGSMDLKVIGSEHRGRSFCCPHLQTWNQEQTWLSVLTMVLGTSFVFLNLRSLIQKMDDNIYFVDKIIFMTFINTWFEVPVTCVLPKVISFY